MQITETNIYAKAVTVVIEGLMEGDEAPKITLRMPLIGNEQSSLAFHRLTTLKQARDVISAEIDRLTKIVDQT
jgi:hypothetical protein